MSDQLFYAPTRALRWQPQLGELLLEPQFDTYSVPVARRDARRPTLIGPPPPAPPSRKGISRRPPAGCASLPRLQQRRPDVRPRLHGAGLDIAGSHNPPMPIQITDRQPWTHGQSGQFREHARRSRTCRGFPVAPTMGRAPSGLVISCEKDEHEDADQRQDDEREDDKYGTDSMNFCASLRT